MRWGYNNPLELTSQTFMVRRRELHILSLLTIWKFEVQDQKASFPIAHLLVCT